MVNRIVCLIPGRSMRHIWHRGSHHRSRGRQSMRRSKGRSSQHIHKLHKEERHQPRAQHQQTSCPGTWHRRCKGSHHRSKGRRSIRRCKGKQHRQHTHRHHREERHQPLVQHQQTSFLGICSLHMSRGRLHRCRDSQNIHRSRGQHSHRLRTGEQHLPLAQHQQTSCHTHHHHKQRKQKDKH